MVDTHESFPSSAAESSVDPASLVGRAAQTAHQTVDSAADSAQSAIERFEDTCAAMCDVPERAIREKPLLWVGCAFLVGYLIGKLR